jgi:hypothetical protein
LAITPVIALSLALAACGSSSGHSGSADAAHASFLRFSICMRSHGVANFPDPSPGGGLRLTPDSGIDPFSPAFQAAQQHCRKLLPGGGPPGSLPESVKLQALRFAQCMRANGVPNFPDPVFPKGGGILEGGPGAGINPISPAFKHAQAACGGSGRRPVLRAKAK